MSIRRLIYIPSEELSEAIKKQAELEGRSVSAYLINLHREHMGCLGNDRWEDESNSKSEKKRLDYFKPKPKGKK